MPRRRKVSEDLAASIRFAVDLRCCLCEDKGALPRRATSGQIHHLDGNPSNNSAQNLVWLCLEHHEEAGKRGRVSRRLSAKTIIRFRDELERRVRRQRNTEPDRTRSQRSAFFDALDAGIVLDVHKMRRHIYGDLKGVEGSLREISFYPHEMGYEARRAILGLLDDLAARTRFKMPETASRAIRACVVDLLPLMFLDGERSRRTSPRDAELLRIATSIGEALAYDGALKLGNIRIAEDGCDILWRVLSYAVIHRHASLRARVEAAFDTALDAARRAETPEALTLVTVTREYGESGGTRLPEYPDKLVLAL
jgi:hypothetical protein